MSLNLRHEWGSENADHRRAIREALLSQFGSDFGPEVLDLSVIPQTKNGFISIAHTRGLGGYIHDKNWIGLDVELNERVTPETAARSASMEEFAAAPDAASLWCAKEAIFKCLRYAIQPKTIFELRVKWISENSFYLENHQSFAVAAGAGVIERRNHWTIAVFKTHSPPRDD